MITVYRAALAAVLVTAGGAAIAPTLLTTRTEREEQQTIQAVLDQTYAKYKNLKEGKNADYIPALAKVNPDLFGIALVTADGKVYTAGDISTEVSIQSISKVFTMAKVIEEQGPEKIEKTIGVDATGMRFNSIVSIEFSQKSLGGPEMNSLVNPGAIATTSMVKGSSAAEVWNSILSYYSDFAGRPLAIRRRAGRKRASLARRGHSISPPPARTASLTSNIVAALPASCTSSTREHARLRRFHRQPAIHHHRQSRRESAGDDLPDGLRASPAREDLGTARVVENDAELIARLLPAATRPGRSRDPVRRRSQGHQLPATYSAVAVCRGYRRDRRLR